VRIPEWYPPGVEHGVKELVTTATRMARASLALRAGRYTGSKGGSAADYREYIGDTWSDLLAALYAHGKLRWGYAVPADPHDRRLLRELCHRMLAFENDFLARYRVYLLGLLRTGDASARAYARQKLREETIFPDDEVRAALLAEDELANPHPRPLSQRARGARSE
jgi:hypothetical protein